MAGGLIGAAASADEDENAVEEVIESMGSTGVGMLIGGLAGGAVGLAVGLNTGRTYEFSHHATRSESAYQERLQASDKQ